MITEEKHAYSVRNFRDHEKGAVAPGIPGATAPLKRLALAGDGRGAGLFRAAGDLRAEPHERVVLAARDALLHGDQRVVRDLDVLGADLRAALGDVAVAEAEVVLRDVPAVRLVRRVHL